MKDVLSLDATGTFLLVVATYFAFHFATLTHELGHYAVARIFNIRVTRFVVGHYCVLIKRRHRGTMFVIRALNVPWRNAHVMIMAEKDTRRYHFMLVILAGPIVNMIFSGLFALLNHHMHSVYLVSFLLVSLSKGIGNLLPVKGSDGRLAFDLMRHNK